MPPSVGIGEMPYDVVLHHVSPSTSNVFSSNLLPLPTLSSICDQILFLSSSTTCLGALVVRRLLMGRLATVAMLADVYRCGRDRPMGGCAHL